MLKTAEKIEEGRVFAGRAALLSSLCVGTHISQMCHEQFKSFSCPSGKNE